jgi:CS domain
VLEFSEFLKIEPCTTASTGHLYIGSAAASGAAGEVQQVDCRVDHYETPADVRVTVYAKGVDVSASKIEMQEDAVVLSLALPPAPAGSTTPRRHERVLKLFAPIDAASSTYNITKFKVDLVLVKKVAGQSWLSLESTDKAFGYGLTFGRNKANAAA